MQCGIANYTHGLVHALINSRKVRAIVITERTGEPPVRGNTLCIPSFNRSEDYVEDILHSIVETRPDIVHIQHDYTLYGLSDRFFNLLKRIGLNLVVTMHEVHTPATIEKIGYGVENLARNHAELGKLVTKIVTHSDTMKRWLVEYGVEARKVEVIPHGTTVLPRVNRAQAKRAVGFSEKDRVILSLGFIRRFKNDRLLIEALPEVLKEVPNSHLLLVGGLHPYSSPKDVEEAQTRRSMVHRLGLDRHVRFVERYVNEREMHGILGCADVLVYLHDKPYVEVSGAVHLGIGAGKPIVATSVTRFEEVQKISPETVLTPGNTRLLAEILSRVLTDNNFASDLARRTKAYARQTSWNEVAEHHYLMYREMQGHAN